MYVCICKGSRPRGIQYVSVFWFCSMCVVVAVFLVLMRIALKDSACKISALYKLSQIPSPSPILNYFICFFFFFFLAGLQLTLNPRPNTNTAVKLHPWL